MKTPKLLTLLVWSTITLLGLTSSQTVWAAPYFFVSGSNEMIAGYSYSYSIYLYTDNQTVTAAQTVLGFDKTKVEGLAIGTFNSRCSFWAPADPSLGYGNQTTPYFYNQEKLVLSCGFANPGYNSSSNAGDLIAKVTLTATSQAQGTTNLSFSNSLFRYIGTPITPNPGLGLTLTVFNSTQSAFPTATPIPTPTPVNARTVSSDSLNIIDFSSSSANTSSSQNLNLSALQLQQGATASNTIASSLNNAIPTPPQLSPRPTVTPLVIPTEDPNQPEDSGEVLSIQSLRELLLPGKSEADQTVVLVNLISTIAFIVILAVLIWRLIMISRMNRLKSKHLKELLAGELAAMESKLAGEVDADDREVVSNRFEELKQKLDKG